MVHALTLTTFSWPNSVPNMSAVQPSTVCELTVAPLSTSDDSVSASPACAPRTVRSSLRAAATVEAHAVEASLALATGARTFGRTTEASSRPSAQRSQTTVFSLHRHGGDTVCVRRFCLKKKSSRRDIESLEVKDSLCLDLSRQKRLYSVPVLRYALNRSTKQTAREGGRLRVRTCAASMSSEKSLSPSSAVTSTSGLASSAFTTAVWPWCAASATAGH